jgi:hypothetical protein
VASAVSPCRWLGLTGATLASVKVALVTFLLTMSLAAAAACGGGEDRLSREELISQADAICVKYLKDAAALGLPESVEEIGEWAAADKRNFATPFSLTCQFRSESAEEMKHGCDVVFSSFQSIGDLRP